MALRRGLHAAGLSATWHASWGMQENYTGVVWALRAACPAEMEIWCSVQGKCRNTIL